MSDVLLQVCSSTKGNPDIVFELHIHWSQIHHEKSENQRQKNQAQVRIPEKKNKLLLDLGENWLLEGNAYMILFCLCYLLAVFQSSVINYLKRENASHFSKKSKFSSRKKKASTKLHTEWLIIISLPQCFQKISIIILVWHFPFSNHSYVHPF